MSDPAGPSTPSTRNRASRCGQRPGAELRSCSAGLRRTYTAQATSRSCAPKRRSPRRGGAMRQPSSVSPRDQKGSTMRPSIRAFCASSSGPPGSAEVSQLRLLPAGPDGQPSENSRLVRHGHRRPSRRRGSGARGIGGCRRDPTPRVAPEGGAFALVGVALGRTDDQPPLRSLAAGHGRRRMCCGRVCGGGDVPERGVSAVRFDNAVAVAEWRGRFLPLAAPRGIIGRARLRPWPGA